MTVYFTKNNDHCGWRFTLLPTIFIEKDEDEETLDVSIEWLFWNLDFVFSLWKR
jgi:hypothetical protein